MGQLIEHLKREQELRKRWAGIENKRSKDVKEIRKGISEVNESLARLRELRKDLRADDKDAKADDVADRIEDQEDVKDDLLAALDDAKDRDREAEKILEDHRERVAALRKKREARKKAREGNGDLSPHFSMAEFNCRDGTPVPSYMRPHLEALCKQHLEPARAANGPIRITSGYRHARYNAAIGGASQSYHVYELRKTSPAADHTAQGASPGTLQRWYDTHTNPDGMGYYAGFTHIDERGYRSRWSGAG
jgi:hypothetical protein